ncbi:hypothetical protein FKM82_027475 [Ascaphus truei]
MQNRNRSIIHLWRRARWLQTAADGWLSHTHGDGRGGKGNPPSHSLSLQTGHEGALESYCPSSPWVELPQKKKGWCWDFSKHAVEVTSEDGDMLQAQDELYFINIKLPIISPGLGEFGTNKKP